MDAAAFESQMTPPWELLDEHTAAVPQPAGAETIGGEQLDRFDVFIPAGAFEDGQWVTILDVGLIDPSNGVAVSFWFTDNGQLRRMTATGKGVGGSTSFEYWSHLFDDLSTIEAPAAPRSWSEYKALHD